MSLMGTLAKVAIGVAVAKGAQSVLAKGRGAKAEGGQFGAEHSPDQMPQGTGLEDMMSDILGGKGGQGGGIGDLLEGLTSGSSTSGGGIDGLLKGGAQSGGDLGSLIENLTAGSGGQGGLGGLLGSLAGAIGGQGGQGTASAPEAPNGDFGNVLNQAFERRGEPEAAPTREQDAVAGLMLKAMIQAAKSDGKVDDAERSKLLDNLGDVSPEERDFVNRELAAPIDVDGLARQVPRGLEQQTYAMSVLGIDLDNQNEAQYLHALGTALSLDKPVVNAIHEKLGAPTLYS